MTKTYQEIEVEKILQDKELKFPQNLAFACTWILGNLKGLNLKILDMREKSSLADYYVLCSATNKTQASSMADQISVQVKKNGYQINGFEGRNEADWVLIDIGDVIIHIFLESSRGVYNLDGLWADVPTLDIPNDYYFSEPEEMAAATGVESEKDYF